MRDAGRTGGVIAIPLCGLAVLSVLAATAWTQPVITEFPVPTASSQPFDIVRGPDGNMWFTERSAIKIGRIDPYGSIVEFPLEGMGEPVAITAGPDLNLWFTQGGPITTGVIKQMSQSGVVTDTVELAFDYSEGIAAGSDGRLWFTAPGRIGHLSTDGFLYDDVPVPGGAPFAITAGPDGNLWFTEHSPSRIARITTAGVITEFLGITADSNPADITTGPDGNLWFTGRYADKIGRITPSGVVAEFGGLTAGSRPYGIAAGCDGNLWFTEYDGNRIGRITPGGVVTEFTGLTAGSKPTSIAAGSANTLWFTESSGNRIGRVTLPSCDLAETIPAAGGYFVRSTIAASTTSGSCGGGGAPEKVFRWTPSVSGTAIIQTCGNDTDFDTVLYLRSSSCTGAEVACNDDACANASLPDRASRVTPTVTAGQTYYIVVDGYSSPGKFGLTVIPPQPGCTSPIVVPGQGASYFGTLLGASTLTGSCGGDGPERIFQWTPDHSGPATFDSCVAGTEFDSVLYLRTGGCTSGTELACNDDACPTRGSRIETTVTRGQTYFAVLDSYFPEGGNYNFAIIGPTPCDDAFPVPPAGGVFEGYVRGANNMIGNCGGSGPERVYSWTPSVSGPAVVDTCAGATFATVLYIHEGECLGGNTVGCNQIALCRPGLFASRLYPDVTAGQTYYIVVDSADGESGDYTLTITAPAPPTPSATSTSTATATPSRTPTSVPSATSSPSRTATFTSTATPSHTPTRTFTTTPSATASPTRTPSPSPSSVPTATSTPTPSRTSTNTSTATSTPTVVPTHTSSATPSPTVSGTVTASRTPTRTFTTTPSASVSPTRTPSPSPSATAVPTATNTPTFLRTSTPSRTPTSIFTATSTATGIPTNTPSATPSPSVSATRTRTATPSSTAAMPSATPTITPARTFTASPSPTASGTRTPSATPSATPVLSATATRTGTPTTVPTSTPSHTATPTGARTTTATATPSAGPEFAAGDANCDGRVTAADLPALLAIILHPGGPTCGADADCSGAVDDSDKITLIARIFSGQVSAPCPE